MICISFAKTVIYITHADLRTLKPVAMDYFLCPKTTAPIVKGRLGGKSVKKK